MNSYAKEFLIRAKHASTVAEIFHLFEYFKIKLESFVKKLPVSERLLLWGNLYILRCALVRSLTQFKTSGNKERNLQTDNITENNNDVNFKSLNSYMPETNECRIQEEVIYGSKTIIDKRHLDGSNISKDYIKKDLDNHERVKGFRKNCKYCILLKNEIKMVRRKIRNGEFKIKIPEKSIYLSNPFPADDNDLLDLSSDTANINEIIIPDDSKYIVVDMLDAVDPQLITPTHIALSGKRKNLLYIYQGYKLGYRVKLRKKINHEMHKSDVKIPEFEVVVPTFYYSDIFCCNFQCNENE